MSRDKEATPDTRVEEGPTTRRSNQDERQNRRIRTQETEIHRGRGRSNTQENIDDTQHETEERGEEQEPDQTNNRRESRQQEKESRWRTPFGNSTDNKEPDTVRIRSLNVNTFPAPGDPKMTMLRKYIQDADCWGLGELNRNHYKLTHTKGVSSNVSQWMPGSTTTVGWKRDREWKHEFQQGGVSITAQGTLKEYYQGTGEDEKGLGRWVWMKFEGRDNVKTAIVQLYRPVKNTDDAGSTYNQQLQVLDREPLSQFDSDLQNLLSTLRQEGYRLVVMGDFNRDMSLNRGLRAILEGQGLKDALTERHGQGPASHIRGSKAIDGIWVSQNIEMLKGGVEAGNKILSDHRMLWVDLTLDSILGARRGTVDKPSTRRLKTTNKEAVHKFNSILQRELKRHKLVKKAKELWEAVRGHGNMTDAQYRVFEGIDEQRSRAVQHAERRCRRLRPNQLEFSDKLAAAICDIEVFRYYVFRLRKKKRPHMKTVQHIKQAYKIQTMYPAHLTLIEAQRRLKQAYSNFREVQKQTPQLRQEFMAAKLKEAEEAGEIKKAKEIKEIIERERTKAIHKRVKGAQGKLQRGGVKFIEKEQEDGTRRVIKDKDEMEEAIAASNMKRVQQANVTDTRTGELGDFITDADYDRWEQIVTTDIPLPQNMAEGTKLWLEYMRQEDYTEENIEITVDEYIRSWNKVKEDTSSAPHPLNFSTMKAMKWGRDAAELHTHMSNIVITTGRYPKRWEQCVNSMLPKKKNDWRPDKLRLTSLMMADCNHNNKILGRIAMKRAEKKKLLAKEQYGSRRRLSASLHALNKRLVLDILRLQRKPGIIIANDAKSCYDRILHFAAYISLRRAGLPRKTVISMLEPIRRMTHKIRTAYGDSEMTYGGEEWERDPHGILQGNGAGPAIWALVSSPLLELLRIRGFGATLHGCIGKTFFHMCGFAFVDDADIVQTGHMGESTGSLIRKAQEELNLWEELIKATGGAIVPDKSDYTAINFKWDTEGNWTYEKPSRRVHLEVKDDEGNKQKLTHTPASQARRTLGVWQAADGNEKKQTAFLMEKAEAWVAKAKDSSLSKNDTTFGVQRSLYPAITYGLMATAMHKNQTEKVDKEIRKILPKMGYCRSTPKTLVHGHTAYGGIGLRDIDTIQGTEHIKALLQEAGSGSPTDQLLQIVIDQHTLERGRQGDIFKGEDKDLHLYTSTWMSNTIQFIKKNGLQVEGNQTKLKKWCTQDTFIMDDILRAPGTTFTESEIKDINRCRMHLGIVTTSDMTDGTGRTVRQGVWECDKDIETTSQRAYHWPCQMRPGKSSITVWQRALQAAYGIDRRHRDWTHNPGNWTQESFQYKDWRYSMNRDSLYQRRGTTWRRWRKRIHRSRSAQYEGTDEFVENHNLPDDSKIVEVQRTGINRARHLGYRSSQRDEEGDDSDSTNDSLIENDPQRTLVEHMHSIHEALRWGVEEIIPPEDDGEALALAIMEGKGEFVCDGSLKDSKGTAAALAVDTATDDNLFIRNRTQGRVEEMSSYRAELGGILAVVLGVHLLCQRWNITKGRVTVGCDNEAAVWNVFGSDEPTTTVAGFNLVRTIRHLIKESPLEWQGKHVKGHQDRKHKNPTNRELDKWALTNIEADKQAKAFMARTQRKPLLPHTSAPPPGAGWCLMDGRQAVEKDIDDVLHRWLSKPDLQEYWIQKDRMEETQQSPSAWNQYEKAQKQFTQSQKRWSVKHFSGWEATGQKMKQRKQRATAQCPRCPVTEDSRHIIRCPSAGAEEAFTKALKPVIQWVIKTSSPDMKEAILETCTAYRENRYPNTADHWIREIKQAAANQRRLGMNAMMEGLAVPDWVRAQARWLDSRQSTKCPKRWVTQLIHKLMLISWDMWLDRNGMVHNNVDSRRKLFIAELDASIRRIMQVGRSNRFLPSLDKQVFLTDLPTLLAGTEYTKTTWLQHAQRILVKDERRMARSTAAQGMRRWLMQAQAPQHQQQTHSETTRATEAIQPQEAHQGTQREQQHFSPYTPTQSTH